MLSMAFFLLPNQLDISILQQKVKNAENHKQVLYVQSEKNRSRNSISFCQNSKKRGTLVGPTFFGTFFFCQKNTKNIVR